MQLGGWFGRLRLTSPKRKPILLAAPWLATLLPLLGGDGPPAISLRLRGPSWLDALFESDSDRGLARAATMPFFYAIKYGVFGLGAFAFWRKAGRRGFATDLAQVLVIATAASFIIGSFLRSTILNNDLGWRVTLFAQLATLVWTLSAIRAGAFGDGALSAVARISLLLGYVTMAYALVQIRWNPPQDSLQQATLRDEILAWTWLDTNLPEGAVVQSQPNVERAFSYGSVRPLPDTSVRSSQRSLVRGAGDAVEARIAAITPIFADSVISYSDVRRIAAQYGMSALIVTALDPVFADTKSWVASTPANFSTRMSWYSCYRSPNMTIFDARHASTPLKIAALLAFYATATLIGGCLLAILLNSKMFMTIDVLFYRGLAALTVSGILLLTILGVLARRLPEALGLTVTDTVGATLVSLSLLLAIFVLGPVTFDRSISIFLLSQFELADAPISQQAARNIFVQTYVDDWDQIGRRLREQEVSGNLERTPQGWKLTAQGHVLMESARVMSHMFGGDPRFVGSNVTPNVRLNDNKGAGN